jgi:DAACS family dicarboxylate/amino acid:cation (Na+ or H+) symporter
MASDRSQHLRILAGLSLGIFAGVAARALGRESEDVARSVDALSSYVAHPIGQVFLRLLFFVVVPLVFASLAAGVARLGNLSKLGRLGGRTLLFFLSTSAFACVLSLVAMGLVQPGVGFDPAVRDQLMSDFASDAASVKAASQAQQVIGATAKVNQVLDMFVPRNVLGAITRMEMLPLIVLALLFGAALTLLPRERRDAMVLWLDTLADAMVGIVGFAMRLAPYAVFCLVFVVASRFGWELLTKLAMYVGVVIGCYLIQLFGLYSLLLRWLAGRSPLAFFRRATPILVTAFSTSSSNATLPTSIRLTHADLGVRESVCGFVLPLGATMNMNGTALFEGAVVLFVAQIFGVELSLSQQTLVVILCVLASVGAAGVPGGSLPLVMVVMAQVGVPPDGLALVLGVDRLLDMGRTVVNVMGDVVCAAYLESVEARAESPSASDPAC